MRRGDVRAARDATPQWEDEGVSTPTQPPTPAPAEEYKCNDKDCWAEVVLALIVGGQLLFRAMRIPWPAA